MSARASTPPAGRLLLSALVKRTVLDGAGQVLGRLSDVVVRLRGEDYPAVTGLVARVAGRDVFVPAAEILAWDTDRLELTSARVDLRRFERRPREVLLRADVLGHRLVDVDHARLVRAFDVALRHTGTDWVAGDVDVHRPGWLHGGAPAWRDWKTFEALIGHQDSLRARSRLARLRRLKPAEIADLLEEASSAEQDDILARVHADPELEADVFEELEEEPQSRLLEARSDTEAAEVLSRMRADDAADAVMELPQDRRRTVLELLPAPQRGKVMALLGHPAATAGGLMGVDYLSLPLTATVGDALDAVRVEVGLQPEALVTVYCHDDQARLAGAVSLVALLQHHPDTPLAGIADPDPVHVRADADLVEVTLTMSDYNLLTLPVLDQSGHILGVVTVDDILEASIPRDWRRRELPTHPDALPTQKADPT